MHDFASRRQGAARFRVQRPRTEMQKWLTK
jgi:hypothetical protein